MKGRWAYRPTTRRLISVAGTSQRGNRTLGNPFLTLGLEWCPTCKSETDCDTEAQHRESVYVFRRWCRRCGTVIKWGSFAAPLLHGSPLPALAFEWCTEPGKDRR